MYAEILRDASSSEIRKIEAKNMLRLVDWKNIYYDDVLEYTKEVAARKEKAAYINDKIGVEKIIAAESKASPAAIAILERAETEFRADRLAEAEALLAEFRSAVEKELAQASVISGIAKSSKNFFQRYWKQILVAAIAFIIIGYGAYKLFEKRILRRKYKKMKAEEESLLNLMKKAQTERYKDNKISNFVYNIRIKKYEGRMQEIKRELPAIEAKLKKK